MAGLSFSNMIILFIFFATLAGGAMARGAIVISKKYTDVLFIFCGGLLIGIIGFELIPHSYVHYSIIGVLIGCLIGLFLMMLIDLVLGSLLSKVNLKGPGARTFLFLFIAIAFHNIPTGLALGTSMTENATGGTLLFIAIFLHHIPEGLALMLTVVRAGYSTPIFLTVSLMLAVLLGVSFNVGGHISDLDQLNSVLMGIAITTLSYVSVYEIVWKNRNNVHINTFIWTLFVSIMMMVLVIKIMH